MAEKGRERQRKTEKDGGAGDELSFIDEAEEPLKSSAELKILHPKSRSDKKLIILESQ
jgi:hypothetical protein